MKYILFTLILCLLLTGCGRQPVQTAHFSVSRADTCITLDAPAEPVLAALGAPFGYGESLAPGRAGVEKTYRFQGLKLRTYPGQDGERILGVTITAGGQRTPEGIAVGDSAAQVRQCFGPQAIREDRCTLRRPHEQMEVRLQNNVVASIAYSLI